jgi:nucleoside-diphosphate-sugar epimerase
LLGVEPVVVDVFDAKKLGAAVSAAQPAVIVHQLTDLPPALDPGKMATARVRNAHIRDIGTRNLVTAALAAGTKRFVAQSVSFAYAPGPMPYREDWPLNAGTLEGASGVTARGVVNLERQVLAAPLAGIVLRYGKLYGPDTGFDVALKGGPVHVDAAADAARRAVSRGRTGAYNIAEEDGAVSNRKAAAELDWRADFRMPATT